MPRPNVPRAGLTERSRRECDRRRPPSPRPRLLRARHLRSNRSGDSEKATVASSSPYAARSISDENRLKSRVSWPSFEWRDPDSNRGHHDFQTLAHDPRTRRKPIKQAGPATGPPDADSRPLGSLSARCGAHHAVNAGCSTTDARRRVAQRPSQPELGRLLIDDLSHQRLLGSNRPLRPLGASWRYGQRPRC
jgi:hypothetical protein